jgi:hypothetical protein
VKRRARLAIALAVASTACADLLGLHEPTIDDTLGSDADASGCAIDCLGGACNAGQCMPLAIATDQLGPVWMTQTPDRVFWTNDDGAYGNISSAYKADGGLGVLAAYPLADQPWGITTDDASIYVANRASGTVMQCTLTQCTQQSILDDSGIDDTNVAVSGGYLYFIQAIADDISRVPIDGGALQQVALPNTTGFYGEYAGLVTDGTYVYWSEPDNGRIYRQGIAGGKAILVLQLGAGSYPTTLLLNQGLLYYATLDNTVAVINADGTGTPMTFTTTARYPWGIALDDTYVYWTEQGDLDNMNVSKGNGGVFRCPLAGCTQPEALASNLVGPRGIVVDATAIYFGTFGTLKSDGAIWRLAKP